MLDEKGFDLWADGYDRSVGLSDEDGTYPFAGYRAVLGAIYARVLRSGARTVLDIGFGTGTLTARLYARGCEIYGQDFSARMIELARAKMPGAHLVQADFAHGLAQPLAARTYDAIVATYSLHHLTNAQKVEMIRALRAHLNPCGRLYIGDVAFTTRTALAHCRADAGDAWDDEEIYFVIDELRAHFPALRFESMSACAGVLEIGAD